jgi:hypothetical protein
MDPYTARRSAEFNQSTFPERTSSGMDHSRLPDFGGALPPPRSNKRRLALLVGARSRSTVRLQHKNGHSRTWRGQQGSIEFGETVRSQHGLSPLDQRAATSVPRTKGLIAGDRRQGFVVTAGPRPFVPFEEPRRPRPALLVAIPGERGDEGKARRGPKPHAVDVRVRRAATRRSDPRETIRTR